MCSCLQCSQLSELVHFLFWELSMSFYIFHRHRVCLVDGVDLICSFYRVFFLATLPLGFNCGFISSSACGLSPGFFLLRLPCRTWICPCEARCGGAVAWVTGVLVAQDTQGSWQLGQHEIQCSRRVCQPVLANMHQYSCL